MPDRKLEPLGRKTIYRFPRLAERALQGTNSDSSEDKAQAEREALETEAIKIIGNFRTMKVEIGRIFIRIKATLKHGEWEGYYAKTFGDSSVSFRSDERYMLLATKVKTDSLTVLKPGTGPEAQETHDATAEAVAEIGDIRKPEPVYRLALHLSADQRDATIRLWKSPHRRRAEKKIVALLDQLLIRFDDQEAR
jgi:hypothetical protein